jgi:hypothetical protein
MTALLVLYMSQALFMPGHIEHIAGFASLRRALESMFGPMSTLALASQIYGLHTGFVYFTPVLGGLIDLLGVLSLGENSFRTHLQKQPQSKKLRTLLHLINPESTDRLEQLLEVAKSLAAARNTFVHPKVQEGDSVVGVGPQRGDVESAREAMTEMLFFFRLLREYDRTYATFFILW